MSNRYKPDQNRIHTYEVNEISGPEKTFNSQQGQKEKYIIRFKEHGYEAEYCPLVGSFSKSSLPPGTKFTFRIAFRKDFRDEIEPATVDQVNEDGVVSKTYSMVGHPAAIALRAATDLNVARQQKAGAKADAIPVSDVITDAETMLSWLLKKAAGEE